mgnify:FL=1
MKKVRILNLGAGVQSTTIALRIATGEYPPIEAAIFADTQEEPSAVYRHLQWLIEQTKDKFPTLVRTKGRIGDDLLRGDGGHGNRFASIPAFTLNAETGDTGKLKRQCTAEYKLDVIERTIRREVLGLKFRGRVPKDVEIIQIMGLSFDEPGRILRTRANMTGTHFKPEFPLAESYETRANCKEYLESVVPYEVPRSACVFCPFHNNEEWRRIKETDPVAWARAVEIDEGLRIPGLIVNRKMDQAMFLHRQCVPLEQADIEGPDRQQLQYGLGFTRECLGMCGV